MPVVRCALFGDNDIKIGGGSHYLALIKKRCDIDVFIYKAQVDVQLMTRSVSKVNVTY